MATKEVNLGSVRGPQGAAATVTVGKVTTGAAGSNAAVTNSGTSGAAILNFTIPRGAQGTPTTVNGKTGASITLNANDVGARPNNWTPSASEVGALPKAAGSYSTSEVNTGKTWIDGKTIYRRVFKLADQKLPQLQYTTYVPMSSFSNLDQFVSITALLYSDDPNVTQATPIMLPCALGDSVVMVQTSSRGVELYRTQLSDKVYTGSWPYPTGSTNGLIFIVEYTKK